MATKHSFNNLLLTDFINQVYDKIYNFLSTFRHDKEDRRYLIFVKCVELFVQNLKEEIELQQVECSKFQKVFESKFYVFLCNFICYFSGLKCLIYLDPFSYLSLEFYGDDTIYEHLAEKFNYSLQLKILTNFKIHNFKKNKENLKNKNFSTLIYNDATKQYREVTNIHEKNQIQFHKVNFEDVSCFPPYLNFTKKKKPYFRKYTTGDLFHDCKFLTEQNKENDEEVVRLRIDSLGNCPGGELKCSIFRNIDKLRLLQLSLTSILSVDKVKMDPSFKGSKIIRDDQAYENQFQKRKILLQLLNPFDSEGVREINHSLRNFYGEKVGFYFVFISHHLKWTLFPSIFAICYYSLLYAFDWYQTKYKFSTVNSIITFKNLCDIIYIYVISLWAILHIKSWVSQQKFYNYVWGGHDQLDIITDKERLNIDQAIVYLNVEIPIRNTWKLFFLRLLSSFLQFIMVGLTISVNLYLFVLSNEKTLGNKYQGAVQSLTDKSQNLQVKSHFWYTLIPIYMVIVRKILSEVNYAVTLYLTGFERHLKASSYEDSFIAKIAVFEFVNYYFNLFYIAYFKHFYEVCANNDCVGELAHQLITIICTSYAITLLEVLLSTFITIYRKKTLKKLNLSKTKNKFTEKNPRVSINYKTDYYEFMTYEYSEIIFGYGYVVMFGISAPVSFLLFCIFLWLQRLFDTYRLVKLQNVPIIESSKGVGIVLKILKVFIFFSIIISSSLAFFTIDFVRNSIYKWPSLFIVENIIVLVFFLASYDNLPKWFPYIDQIKHNYIVKVLRSDFEIEKETKIALEEEVEDGENFAQMANS
jgi:hypothetical protein